MQLWQSVVASFHTKKKRRGWWRQRRWGRGRYSDNDTIEKWRSVREKATVYLPETRWDFLRKVMYIFGWTFPRDTITSSTSSGSWMITITRFKPKDIMPRYSGYFCLWHRWKGTIVMCGKCWTWWKHLGVFELSNNKKNIDFQRSGFSKKWVVCLQTTVARSQLTSIKEKSALVFLLFCIWGES